MTTTHATTTPPSFRTRSIADARVPPCERRRTEQKKDTVSRVQKLQRDIVSTRGRTDRGEQIVDEDDALARLQRIFLNLRFSLQTAITQRTM
jgi:hypothetical protein